LNKVRDGAKFVGLFASFPVEKDKRRAGILKTILRVDDQHSFKRIRFGSLRGRIDTFAFSEERLEHAIRTIETGETDYLQLIPYKIGDDWVRLYETSVSVDWKSAVIQPYKRPSSPIDTGFGSAGSIKVQYPMSRFTANLESDLQSKLVRVMKRLFVEEQMHWGFIHQGFHFRVPASIGTDDLFQETKEGFPLTTFDADLGDPSGLFREYVKGAFWVNFLNHLHVERIGGIDKLTSEKPSETVEEIGRGGTLLQVGRSPLTSNDPRKVEDYQRLRRFLKPILMETAEDRMRIQRQVLGSWRPPRSAAQNWKELPAEMRDGSAN
jgi:hypothetical protein